MGSGAGWRTDHSYSIRARFARRALAGAKRYGMFMAPSPTLDLDREFRSQRRTLWALAYRVTGSAAEADDLVQDAFLRVLESPPAEATTTLRPWLLRATAELAVEDLRRRRSASYGGPWLPAPIDTTLGVGVNPGVDATDATLVEEGRYPLAESTSFPFLIALEALEPEPRAALVLHDAVGLPTGEMARVFGAEESAIEKRVAAARDALASYKATRAAASPERTRAALESFRAAVDADDPTAAEKLLAPGARAVTDSGGSYEALREPVRGAAAVARAHVDEARRRARAEPAYEVREINGLPALLIQLERPQENQAPRAVLRCDLDAGGRIDALHTILAPAKLAGLRFVRDDD